MDYPQEFSTQARARIEAERLNANRELEQDHTIPAPEGWTAERWDEVSFYAYVLRVFLAFAREACQLGREGRWSVDRVRQEAESYLRQFAMDAYTERGHDRTGSKLKNVLNRWNEDLRPRVYSELRKSDEWRQFEADLLGLAEQQAMGRRPFEPPTALEHVRGPAEIDDIGANPKIDRSL